MTKKQIYIAIIIVCFLASGAVLWFGASPAPAPTPVPGSPVPAATQNSAPAAGAAASLPVPGAKISLPSPSVFPATPNFDMSVFDSGGFTSLQEFSPLTIAPEEIGRDNPFANY